MRNINLFKGMQVRVALNGCGVDKLCSVTNKWNVLFTSMLTIDESKELQLILDKSKEL